MTPGHIPVEHILAPGLLINLSQLNTNSVSSKNILEVVHLHFTMTVVEVSFSKKFYNCPSEIGT